MSGEQENFDRVLQIQEKSILAWERTFGKLEDLVDEIKSLRCFSGENSKKIDKIKIEIEALKEAAKTILNNLQNDTEEKREEKRNEVLVRRLKIWGAVIALLTAVSGALFVIFK